MTEEIRLCPSFLTAAVCVHPHSDQPTGGLFKCMLFALSLSAGVHPCVVPSHGLFCPVGFSLSSGHWRAFVEGKGAGGSFSFLVLSVSLMYGQWLFSSTFVTYAIL